MMPTTTAPRISLSEDMLRPQMLQLRDFRPFKTADEYLWAMKEDLSDWLNRLYPELDLTPETFINRLETGVALCKHANNVRQAYFQWVSLGKKPLKSWGKEWNLPPTEVTFVVSAKPYSFFARDNAHNFITWCRKLGILECLLFESDDLVLGKNEKNVILCLLEVARKGYHFGMAAPMLVQFEREIDRDIAKEAGEEISSSGEEEESESLLEYGPVQQIITNDLRSLDERVRELVERCTCPTQFAMIRVAEGKYKIGDSKLMIYVRILRNHVMVRVGGGWDTLGHYLDKHDPCRCSSGHRAAISSKLIMKNEGVGVNNTPQMKVEYQRRDLSLDSHVTPTPSPFGINTNNHHKKAADLSDSGSEISDEGYKTSDNSSKVIGQEMLINGARERSGSLVRTRSLSTDEDRPDSRSTDEDVGVTKSSKPRTHPAIITKSQSTSRVPSCSVRTRDITNTPVSTRVVENKRFVSRERPFASSSATTSPKHGQNSHPPSVRVTRPQPARSLSASNSTEFYGRSKMIVKQASTPSTPQRRVSGPTPRFQVGAVASGDTQRTNPSWSSGYGTGPRIRNSSGRPSISNVWGITNGTTRRQNSDLWKSSNRRASLETTEGSSTFIPDLATCIRKALDLESDAEKIAHITNVLEQYQSDSHNDARDIGGLQEPVSLPYIHSTNIFSRPSQPLAVSKRKETGFTRIPKPNFY